MPRVALLIFFSFLASLGHAKEQAKKHALYDYQGSDLVQVSKELPNLASSSSFDGRFFKVVKGKSSTALPFDSPLAQKAAQVYFHLERARSYFQKIAGMDREWPNQKIIIRLEIPNHFNPYTRFSHDDYRRETNTAETIPPSSHERLEEAPSWGPEIWFRPAKKTKSSASTDALAIGLERSEGAMLEALARSFVLRSTAQATEGKLLQDIFGKDALVLGALSFGLIKSLPTMARFFGKVFKRQFYLDTAMIPEIVYHEYAHFALSDKLDLVSTPVIEGIANFYAGRISGESKWGHGPREYSRDVGRNAYSRVQYSFAQERKDYATSSFVFKLLWSLGEITPKPDELVLRASSHIKRESNIKRDLVDSLFLEIESGPNELQQKLALHGLIQRLGL